MEENKMQYLFGMHPVLEAVKAGKKFDKVLLKQGLEGPQFRELMELLKENEIPFQFVPGERLNKAVRGAHQAINADAVKASAGALMRMDTCKVSNLRVAAYYLQQSGFRLIAATEKTDNLIYDVDMTGPCAIIMGSEGKGISQAMLDLADDKAAIPMAGEITSLNVSVASAVLMYEAVRQRLGK